MAAITIKDLDLQRDLDGQAMARVKGAGGAGWVYGWARPYIAGGLSEGGSVINFFQTNNLYQADQMNNQFQIIDVKNSAANATINLAPTQVALNALRA